MSIAAASTAINLFSFTGRFFYELGRFAVMRGIFGSVLSSTAKIALVIGAYKFKGEAWASYEKSDFRERIGKPYLEPLLSWAWSKVPEAWQNYIKSALEVLGVYFASGGNVNLAVRELAVTNIVDALGHQDVKVDKRDVQNVVTAVAQGSPVANTVANIIGVSVDFGVPGGVIANALVPAVSDALGNNPLVVKVGNTMACASTGRVLGNAIDQCGELHLTEGGLKCLSVFLASGTGGLFSIITGSGSFIGSSATAGVAVMLEPGMQQLGNKLGLSTEVVKEGSGLAAAGAAHVVVLVGKKVVVPVIIAGGGAMVHYAQEEPEKALKIFMAALAATAISAGGYYIYQVHGETIVHWYKDGVAYAQKLTDEQLKAILEKNNCFKRIAGTAVGKDPDVEEVSEASKPEEPKAQEQKEVATPKTPVTVEKMEAPETPVTVKKMEAPKTPVTVEKMEAPETPVTVKKMEAPETPVTVEKMEAPEPESQKQVKRGRNSVRFYSPMEIDPEMANSRLADFQIEEGLPERFLKIKTLTEDKLEQTKEQATVALLAAVISLASKTSIAPFALNRYPIGVLSFCANTRLTMGTLAEDKLKQTKQATVALVAAVVLVASNMPKSSAPFMGVITNIPRGLLKKYTPMNPGEWGCKESWGGKPVAAIENTQNNSFGVDTIGELLSGAVQGAGQVFAQVFAQVHRQDALFAQNCQVNNNWSYRASTGGAPCSYSRDGDNVPYHRICTSEIILNAAFSQNSVPTSTLTHADNCANAAIASGIFF